MAFEEPNALVCTGTTVVMPLTHIQETQVQIYSVKDMPKKTMLTGPGRVPPPGVSLEHGPATAGKHHSGVSHVFHVGLS